MPIDTDEDFSSAKHKQFEVGETRRDGNKNVWQGGKSLKSLGIISRECGRFRLARLRILHSRLS